VMAYTVSLQVHDIGVRMALGAQPGDVLAMVLREGVALIVGGIAAGAVASLAGIHYLNHLVWGISKADPWTFAVMAVCVVIIGAGACLLPARRAAKVDPVVALRYE
jgi:putative ABC transport system permease protein